MLEIYSMPSVNVKEVRKYMDGEITAEELFLQVEDKVTGKKCSPEHAKLCVEIAQQIGVLGLGTKGEN